MITASRMFLNISFYNNHKEQFSRVYKGRFLIIKDERIVGDYNTWSEACSSGLKLFNDDNFLVKYCA